MAELSDLELADQFARTLSGHVAEWPQLRPLLGRLAATCAKQEARLNALEPAYNKLVELIESNSESLPPRIVQIIYNETCCKPTPEQAKGEACACVAGHLVTEIEDWAAARVGKAEARIAALEDKSQRLELQGYSMFLRPGPEAIAAKAENDQLKARIAELERKLCQQRSQSNYYATGAAIKSSALTARNAELKADLKDHMHLVRTMGERCDVLGGLVQRWLAVEKQIGPNDTVVGPNTKLIEDSERALSQETRG